MFINNIKFTPEKIADVANILSNQKTLYVNAIHEIRKKAEMLNDNWQGEASQLFWDSFLKCNEESSELEKTMTGFIEKLESVAGVYRTGESEVKQKSESLPTTGIFNIRSHI